MGEPMKLTEYRQELKQASKYRNRKTDVDGITFDSKREADYYLASDALEQIRRVTQ